MPKKKSKVASRGLFWTDQHAQDGSVSLRSDDFFSSVMEKMEELFQIAVDEKVDYVLHGGDLYHKPDPKGTVRNPMLSFLLREDWPFKILTVVGNHDLRGHSLKTIDQLGIYTLFAAGAIEIADEFPDFGIFCGHYRHNIEEMKFESTMPIWAMHSFILPQPAIFDHVTADDFETTAKLVLCGHYHPGYETVTRADGVMFANPGSFGRPTIKDAKHDVKALLVELDGDDVQLTDKFITCAKPAVDIFGEDALEENVEDTPLVEIDTEQFMTNVREARAQMADGKMDSMDLIKVAAKELKPGKDVIKTTVEYIENARKKNALADD